MNETLSEKPVRKRPLSIFKLFMVATAYAASLVAFRPFGDWGIAVSILIGSLASATILVARKGDLWSIVWVAGLGSFGGIAFIGIFLLQMPLSHNLNEEARQLFVLGVFGDVAGTFAGGYLGSFLARQTRRRRQNGAHSG